MIGRTVVASLYLVAVGGLAAAAPVPRPIEEKPHPGDPKQVAQDLKQIGLAFFNYHDRSNHLPNDITDRRGTPLLSWRVAILPYLGDDAAKLHRRFNLDEPWDSPANKRLLTEMPAIYATGGLPKSGKTVYRGFADKGTILEPGKRVTLPGIPDGCSNTILVAETVSPVEWTKPGDLPLKAVAELPKAEFRVLLADGSGARVKRDFDRDEFRKLLLISDAEVVDDESVFGDR